MRIGIMSAVAVLALLGNVIAVAAPGPTDIVQAFNKAISERHLDEALKLVAPGSVQYTLRSSHAETGGGGFKQTTTDLATHWRTIAPIVLSGTTAYQRVPKIIDSRVDGDLATVWVTITSTTVERSGEKRQASFSELYLLVHTAAGWQIGSMADNRAGSSLASSAPKPAK